jgi:hypothetical protein
VSVSAGCLAVLERRGRSLLVLIDAAVAVGTVHALRLSQRVRHISSIFALNRLCGTFLG